MFIYEISLGKHGFFQVEKIGRSRELIGIYYFADDARRNYPQAIDLTEFE